MKKDRNVGWLCCASGSLSFTFSTNRGGYYPGEFISVSAVINNRSNKEIIGLEIQLIEDMGYTDRHGMYQYFISLVNKFYCYQFN